MKTTFFVKTALAALSVALLVPFASAATIITFSGTDAAGDSFSGIFNVHADASIAGAYDITGGSGTFTRVATGLTQGVDSAASRFNGPWDVNNPVSSPGNFYQFDNIYYAFPGDIDDNPFDANGFLLVLADGTQVNIYFLPGTSSGFFGETDGFGQSDLTSFTSSVETVTPEPGSLVLFGTGVLGLAGVVRRRFSI